jgi:hypothetical protein
MLMTVYPGRTHNLSELGVTTQSSIYQQLNSQEYSNSVSDNYGQEQDAYASHYQTVIIGNSFVSYANGVRDETFWQTNNDSDIFVNNQGVSTDSGGNTFINRTSHNSSGWTQYQSWSGQSRSITPSPDGYTPGSTSPPYDTHTETSYTFSRFTISHFIPTISTTTVGMFLFDTTSSTFRGIEMYSLTTQTSYYQCDMSTYVDIVRTFDSNKTYSSFVGTTNSTSTTDNIISSMISGTEYPGEVFWQDIVFFGNGQNDNNIFLLWTATENQTKNLQTSWYSIINQASTIYATKYSTSIVNEYLKTNSTRHGGYQAEGYNITWQLDSRDTMQVAFRTARQRFLGKHTIDNPSWQTRVDYVGSPKTTSSSATYNFTEIPALGTTTTQQTLFYNTTTVATIFVPRAYSDFEPRLNEWGISPDQLSTSTTRSLSTNVSITFQSWTQVSSVTVTTYSETLVARDSFEGDTTYSLNTTIQSTITVRLLPSGSTTLTTVFATSTESHSAVTLDALTYGYTLSIDGGRGETQIAYMIPNSPYIPRGGLEAFNYNVPIGVAPMGSIKSQNALNIELQADVKFLETDTQFNQLSSLTWVGYLYQSAIMEEGMIDHDEMLFVTKSDNFSEMQIGYVTSGTFQQDGGAYGQGAGGSQKYEFTNYLYPCSASFSTQNSQAVTGNQFTILISGDLVTTSAGTKRDSINTSHTINTTCTITKSLPFQINVRLAQNVPTQKLAGLNYNYLIFYPYLYQFYTPYSAIYNYLTVFGGVPNNTEHKWTVTFAQGLGNLWTEYDTTGGSTTTFSYYSKKVTTIADTNKLSAFDSKGIGILLSAAISTNFDLNIQPIRQVQYFSDDFQNILSIQ